MSISYWNLSETLRKKSKKKKIHKKKKEFSINIYSNDFEQNIQSLKKYNDSVFSKNNSLKSVWGNTKNKIETNDKSGIQSIHCIDCNKCCVGQTCKHLNISLKNIYETQKFKKTKNPQ